MSSEPILDTRCLRPWHILWLNKIVSKEAWLDTAISAERMLKPSRDIKRFLISGDRLRASDEEVLLFKMVFKQKSEWRGVMSCHER